MDHERHHSGVERPIGEPAERLAQVVDSDIEVVPAACAGEPHHLGALVQPHDLGTTREQLLGVEARPAANVEDSTSPHLSEDLENGRTIVEGVVRAAFA